MLISELHVRFFRSFNYDFERKFRTTSKPQEWEDTSPAWFPFIRVPIEKDITAIVGANESGKSQLLTAIEAAITGSPIDRGDFCRYSELYSVQVEEIRYPEFGVAFTTEPQDADLLRQLGLEGVTEFALYRPGEGAPFLVVNGERRNLTDLQPGNLTAHLPTIGHLKTDLAIPDAVSIAELAGEERNRLHDRQQRSGLLRTLTALGGGDVAAAGAAVVAALAGGSDDNGTPEDRRRAEFDLARQLLVDAARIDPRGFIELREALNSGREGQVEAVIGAMNTAIKENLNIQRWWSQDKDFELLVEAREQELAFVIQDRTAAKYSFGERSQGLRFFLSYFVQLVGHRMHAKPDILLLDEPDAYLSSVGQADLLRVLQNFAVPEDDEPRSQVVYVTHSPFLIDKNSPHRIRVLDKGAEDNGTRIVRDAANNRYEPLRSSLGEYVAETAFIGGKNLFVEGHVDQILLVGISAHLTRRLGSTAGVLDLNEVTVIAAGGADAVPYMVYLARGRDTVKPPCVALIDGDSSGRDAEKVLKRGEARKRRVLLDGYIVRLDTWFASQNIAVDDDVQVQEIEDLLPIDMAHRAALNYLARFNDLSEYDTTSFTVESVRSELPRSGGRVWDAIDHAYRAAFPEEHLEKAGLAREVVSLLSIAPDTTGSESLRERFGELLRTLSELLDDAADEEDRIRRDDRVKRAVRNFELDHPHGIRKQDAVKLLRELDSALGTSAFRTSLQPVLEQIAKDFELDDRSVLNVPRFPAFQQAVKAIGSSERIAYQDDATKDPASAVLPMPKVRSVVKRARSTGKSVNTS
jgi:predicted ATPase